MAATAATHQVWRAARWDHEKAPTSPALRACATTKQVQVKRTQIFITDILPCMWNVVPLISQSALTYPLKGITQTSTTVWKTKRRTGQTAVWTAGRTLRKTVSARVKRRRKRARAAMIRWGDKPRTCQFVECRVFSHMFAVKLLMCPQEPKTEGCTSDGNTTGHSLTSANTCRTKGILSSLCGDKLANIALRSPWAVHQSNLSLHMRPTKGDLSLVELLVRLLLFCPVLIIISRKVVLNFIFNIRRTSYESTVQIAQQDY